MSQLTGSPPVSQDQQAEKVFSGSSLVNASPGERGQLNRDSSTYSNFGRSARTPDLDPTARPLSPASWNAEASTPDGSSPAQWSSAVGRATIGKSGRVIERLQAENDRLRRELKLETLRREEEQKKSEVARGQMQSLQATHDNEAHMRELELQSFAKKDRKVKELRAELEGEQKRRAEAENQLKQLRRESERVEEELKAKLRMEVDRAAQATTQYSVLSSSFKQLDNDYRRMTGTLKSEFARIHLDAAEDQNKVDRLRIIAEQHEQEVEKMRVINKRLAEQFEAYKMETENSTREIKERAEYNEKRTEEILEETRKVLGEMKHVINVKKHVRDAE